MPDHTDDIDALLRLWSESARSDHRRYHRALTSLIAERDAVVAERNEYEAITNDLRIQLDAAKSFWRDRAERRDAEQKAAADRDLRERLVCAIWPEIMRQWREYTGAIDPQYTIPIDPRGNARSDALIEADAMIAAMRKGEA